MPTKDLTIKFYEQPEDGEKIGFKIDDSESIMLPPFYIFDSGEYAVDFTYRQQQYVPSNSVMSFNSDFSMRSAFNTPVIVGGATPGFIKITLNGIFPPTVGPGLVNDAEHDGAMTLFVGDFDQYNGYSTKSIVGVGRNGLALMTFGDEAGGRKPLNKVRRHPASLGSWLLGGEAMVFGGNPVPAFWRMTSAGSPDTTFNANVTATGLFNSSSVVDAIEVCPTTNKVYVGFRDSTNIAKVRRFNTNGTLDSSWNAGAGVGKDFNSPTYGSITFIRSIAIDPNNQWVLVGGNFTFVGGTSRRLVAKLFTSNATLQPFILLTDGKDCRSIALDDGGDEAYLAVTSSWVRQDVLPPDDKDIRGKGIIKVYTGNGSIDDNFIYNIGKGIRCDDAGLGTQILDIKVLTQYKGSPLTNRKMVAIAGEFYTFGDSRAENFACFDPLDQYGMLYPGYVPPLETIKFPTGYDSYLTKIIATNIRQGGVATPLENYFMVLGKYDVLQGMKVDTQFNDSTYTYSMMKDIEIGKYKSNVSTIDFTFLPANECEGDITIAIYNTYNPITNEFSAVGEVFEFRYDPIPGQIKIEAFTSLTMENFRQAIITKMTPHFNDLLDDTRVGYAPGWRDFSWNIEMLVDSMKLNIYNQVWPNPLYVTTDFPITYIAAGEVENIYFYSSYADTMWKTWDKLYSEYNGFEINYSNKLNEDVDGLIPDAPFVYGTDADMYGSEIKLSLTWINNPPPAMPREIYYNFIVQLLREIEIFSEEQLVDASLLALTRSPIFLKSTGTTQSRTRFDIYSFIGNIYDNAPISYSIEKQKIATTQNTLYVDIANIVKEDLEADITNFLGDTPVMSLGENESRWVRVIAQDYNGNATGSTTTTLYHVMDGYVSPFELNGAPECIYTFPRILTPHKNSIVRGAAPRLYYRNRDVAVMYAVIFQGYDPFGTPEYFFMVIEPNVFTSQNDLYYNSVDVATYLGTSDQATFGIVYMDGITETITYDVYDECKYDTYELIFKNKWGVLETISMSKKSIKQLNISGDDYLRSIVDINGDYDINRHTKKQFNVNGYEEWTLNTPFIPEYMVESVKQAMLSEEIWIRQTGYFQFGELVRTDKAYPAIRLDQSLVYKTEINDKNIQYTIKVRLSHNEIKNIK